MDDIAFAVVFVRIEDPAPVASYNGAAIAARKICSANLVSDQLPVFHCGMDLRCLAFQARNGISSQATDRQRK